VREKAKGALVEKGGKIKEAQNNMEGVVSVCLSGCIITAISVCSVCVVQEEKKAKRKVEKFCPCVKSSLIHLHIHTDTHIRSHSDHLQRSLEAAGKERRSKEGRKKVMTRSKARH
jgi:hypothetical protein